MLNQNLSKYLSIIVYKTSFANALVLVIPPYQVMSFFLSGTENSVFEKSHCLIFSNF